MIHTGKTDPIHHLEAATLTSLFCSIKPYDHKV
ncbi:MAG: hypothetical protein JWP25_1780 [Bradyrhizobium sp.]|jgi:hypothetical protein|nr:hypothetical protein [Bradyrhizobium sp.]